MSKISKHDLLLKYKDRDDFIFNQVLNIVEYPFNEIVTKKNKEKTNFYEI